MSLRAQRLVQLREGILADERASRDHLFRILYGLPSETQIALASYMTARFLPIFRVHHPNVTWPQEILRGIDQYFSKHGKGLPEQPKQDLGGDTSFLHCLYGLSDAWLYAKDNAAKVTSACCTTLIRAIAARAANVWHADDPQAAHAFQSGDRETWTGRTPHFNVASQAVTKREWLNVVDWLKQHDVGSYPDTEDTEREEVLKWWKDRECLL